MQGIEGATDVTAAPEGAFTHVTLNVPGERDIREALASQVMSAGWGLVELKSVNLSLEEIFLKLTTNETNSPDAKETTHV
jgi:ABC-2 type transport system ATP-binding protein